MMAYRFKLEAIEERSELREGKMVTKKIRRAAETTVPARINQRLGRGRAGEIFSIFAFREAEDYLELMAFSKSHPLKQKEVEEVLRRYFREEGIEEWGFWPEDFQETTLASFFEALSIAEENAWLGSTYRLHSKLGINGIREQYQPGGSRDSYRVREYVSDVSCQWSREKSMEEKAMEAADNIMGSQSLRDEMERIWCDGSFQADEEDLYFFTHPVHYRVRAHSRQSARDIINLLVSLLFENNRLPSKRFTYFSDYDSGHASEYALHKVLENAGWASVAIELGEAETGKKRLGPDREGRFLRALDEDIEQYSDQTLIFLVEIAGQSSEAVSKFLERVGEHTDFVVIDEGECDAEGAKAYITSQIPDDWKSEVDPKDIEAVVPEGRYTVTELDRLHRKIQKKTLRKANYPGYTAFMEARERGEKKEEGHESYDKLMNMVGIREAKEFVDQIIAMHQLRKKRQELALPMANQSLHMVFTGNPGSAKTTVARLIAGILAEKNILSTGAFVECGRADLVAKYVGWTAKTVRSKFDEAEGGVLFIDEAYALVEDHNSFAAEAINTIVQEMENRRDRVLVILAGYPERMEEFIGQNEGLKSRIAFRLDFPDYSADELTKILQSMAKERGLHISPSAAQKCRDIFQEARKEPDFGNGRCARNVLDAAIIRQAERLMKKGNRQITRQMATSLRAEDFAPANLGRTSSKRGKTLGFCFEAAAAPDAPPIE